MKADQDFFYDLALLWNAKERTAALQNAGFLCTWEELVEAYGSPRLARPSLATDLGRTTIPVRRLGPLITS